MNELFEMPKERKARKPFVRTQRYICKRCNRSSCNGTLCMCWRHDVALELQADGSVITGNGSEKIVCDGKVIEIGAK